MPFHEGQYLRKLLKNKGIGVNRISEKFDVSRTAVYQYFDSVNLSEQIKERFEEHFDLVLDRTMSKALESTESLSEAASSGSDLNQLNAEVAYQKQLNEEMQKRIEAQEATIRAQQELINFLSIKEDLNLKLGKGDPAEFDDD